MTEDDDTLLTTEELAERRKCSSSRIEKERMNGDGPPFIRDGNLVRYRLGDFRAWIAAKERFTTTGGNENV